MNCSYLSFAQTMVRLCVWWSEWRMGRRTGVGQADKDDLRLHAKVLGARVQRRLERVARVQAAAHIVMPCQIL